MQLKLNTEWLNTYVSNKLQDEINKSKNYYYSNTLLDFFKKENNEFTKINVNKNINVNSLFSLKYKYFDFGRSTLGAGTYKFKKQWGALAYAHHWYYVLPEGESKPELNPDNPKYKLVIFLWKLMPVWLTKIIGPHIIKHIP